MIFAEAIQIVLPFPFMITHLSQLNGRLERSLACRGYLAANVERLYPIVQIRVRVRG